MQPEEPLAHPHPGAPLRESVTAADWRLLAASLIAVALSIVYIASNYRAAFPQASLRLDLSRQDITAQAASFLASRGHRLDTYRNLTLFDADDEARLFLEREAGLTEANRLMEREVPVWRWRARWYKPPEKEEFRVWLAPDGRLTGFDHVMEEVAPGPSLPPENARALAETFLRERVRWPAALVEEESQDRPRRRDHSFTFERADLLVKGGRIRARVEVRGGRVEAFREYLKVPEQWSRDFAALRSKNELYSQIAQAFYVALMIGAAVTLIGALRRGDITWRPVVFFSGVVAALNVFAGWNNLPFYLDSLPTSTPVAEGLLMILLQTCGSGAGIFIYVLFAFAPGMAAYRDLLPAKLSLPAALSGRALSTREFFRSAIAGLGLAAAHLAFVTAFYLIGQRFGVWSPQDVEQSDLLSTFAPWLYPFTTSLLAASSEEGWFRLLAVPLVKRWTRSNAAAILIPAFVWGFLHANYPQQPGYIRGVEVGLIGVVAGWFLLRFGILSTLIWHYTVDAILFSTYLFTSDSLVLRGAGLAVSGVALIPLAIAVWRYRRDGGFLSDASLTNAALPAGSAPPLHDSAAEEPAPPLPPMMRRPLLPLLGAAGLLAALLLSFHPLGSFVRVHLTRAEAERAAGPGAPGEKQSIEFAPNLDGETFEYLRRAVGREEAGRIVESRTLTGIWRVRQFMPSRKNERYRYIDARGRVFRDDLILDEKSPGASLTPDAARAIAEAHVRGQGLDLSSYHLVDSAAEKREARTDHTFVWEDSAFKAGQARARVSVEVAGDQPTRFRKFLKLPENWQREFRKPRLASLLLPAAIGGFAFLLIGVFLRHVRRAPLRAGRYALVALAAIALLAISEINEWPQLYQAYSTEQPIGDFHSDYLISTVMRLLLAGGGVFLAAYMLDLFLHLLQGNRRWAPLSLAAAVQVATAGAGGLKLFQVIESLIPGDRFGLTLANVPAVETLSPALAVVTSALLAALVGSILLSLGAAAVIVLFPSHRRLGFALAIALCWGLSRAGGASIPLMAFHSVFLLAVFAFCSVVVRSIGAGVTTIGAAIFLSVLIRGAAGLSAQAAGQYGTEAMIALAAGAVVFGGFYFALAAAEPRSPTY